MLGIRRSEFQNIAELSQKVNFALTGAGKALKQLRKRMLRAATAVDKSRDGGQTQVSESNGAAVGRPGR
jgi:hypothetical protein